MNRTPKVVSRDEWLSRRRKLLEREKALTDLGDQVSAERRELPWVRVDAKYVFDGPQGKQSLADLFAGRSQLVVYHFMFGPGWEEGCPSCSFLVDHIDGAMPHINARDTTLIAISRAPYPQIEKFQRRMGWKFHWVSSNANSFNFDYHVSFTHAEMDRGEAEYNFQTIPVPVEDLPGASVFFKDAAGAIYHTYSAYGRGLDQTLGAYTWLDLTPKGRDEENLAFSMAWVRHHDKYGEDYVIDPQAGYTPPKGAACPHCAEEVQA